MAFQAPIEPPWYHPIDLIGLIPDFAATPALLSVLSVSV
jgi:hypothetical protein